METLSKIKKENVKTIFELAVELLKSELEFTIEDFLTFSIEIQNHFLQAMRKE